MATASQYEKWEKDSSAVTLYLSPQKKEQESTDDDETSPLA